MKQLTTLTMVIIMILASACGEDPGRKGAAKRRWVTCQTLVIPV